MNPFLVRDHKLISLVRRVQGLEKRGFECIVPISENLRVYKDFKAKNSSNIEGGYQFDGTIDGTFYACVMRKIEKENVI